MALRPCEMGSNERVHQEVQKVLGALGRGWGKRFSVEVAPAWK